MGVRAVSAVICDEVRREADGNAIIIGARQSGPELSDDEPNVIDRFAVYLELETSYPPPSNFKLRVYNSDSNTTLFESSFDYDVASHIDVPEEADLKGIMLLVSNQKRLEVSRPGEFLIQYSVEDTTWVDVRSFVFPTRVDPEE